MSNVTINTLVEAPNDPAQNAGNSEQDFYTDWKANNDQIKGQVYIDSALPIIENSSTKTFIEQLRGEIPLGAGAQKAVYAHGDHHVVAVYRGAPSVEKMKEEFYKRKLAHLLLPKNIPDVHLAGSKPGLLIAERVLPKNVSPLIRPLKEAVARVKLARRLNKFDIGTDKGSPYNFIYGQNGELTYVDDPIYYLSPKIIRGIKKLAPENRPRALRYARRAFPASSHRLEKLETRNKN